MTNRTRRVAMGVLLACSFSAACMGSSGSGKSGKGGTGGDGGSGGSIGSTTGNSGVTSGNTGATTTGSTASVGSSTAAGGTNECDPETLFPTESCQSCLETTCCTEVKYCKASQACMVYE